jgi:hypothetical protein
LVFQLLLEIMFGVSVVGLCSDRNLVCIESFGDHYLPSHLTHYRRHHIANASDLEAALFNFLPDYLSLLKTRAIIAYMMQNPSRVGNYLLLVVDTLASFGIWLIAFFSLSWIIHGVGYGHAPHIAAVQAYYDSSGRPGIFFFIKHPPDGSGTTIIDPMNIFLYSTLFTSVWVWLYVLSGWLTRTFRFVKKWGSVLTPYLNVEEKPLHSLGVVAICFESLLYWLVAIIVWIC